MRAIHDRAGASRLLCVTISGCIALVVGAAMGECALAAEDSAESATSTSRLTEGTVSEQPPTDGQEAVEATDATQPAEPDGETEPSTPEDESAEVFVPSENISEDISVPFPVDI